MRKLLVLVGATAGSALGWWLGAHVGVMSAFLVSVLGTAAGGYLTKRGLDEHS